MCRKTIPLIDDLFSNVINVINSKSVKSTDKDEAIYKSKETDDVM